MKALLLFVLFLVGLAHANEVKVEINPPKPVAGEIYHAYFRIFTDYDGEPMINFSPYKTEVVGKANQGVTTRTIYSNGKLTTSREITVVYDLSSNEAGSAGLRDITVSLGGATIRHPSVNFSVLKEAEELGEVFLMADVPKKVVFIGEGIVVRYYLYSKVPVSNLDVKKYPKLTGFLKRFLQEPDRSERVSVDGQIYIRNQIYAAKMFPEKLGELKIDPMYMTATIMSGRSNDPFGGLGLGREMKTKSIHSEVVKIDVKPLPENGKPANFTGLVGRHEFDLQVNQSRLIVNEPLEVKLTVSGGGALENFEAPNIISNPALEEFETNGDLKIMSADQATKVFDYTYLAKAELNLPASTVTMSYFDPDSQSYVPVQLPMPQLVVASGGQIAQPRKTTKDSGEEKTPPKKDEPEIPQKLSRPIFEASSANWQRWITYLNFVMAILAVSFALGVTIKKVGLPSLTRSKVPAVFRRGEFTQQEFVKWISPLIAKTGKSPLSLIRESELSEPTKTYFVDLLTANDYKNYSSEKGRFDFQYQSTHFKEIDQLIQSAKDEDSPKPS